MSGAIWSAGGDGGEDSRLRAAECTERFDICADAKTESLRQPKRRSTQERELRKRDAYAPITDNVTLPRGAGADPAWLDAPVPCSSVPSSRVAVRVSF